MISIHSPRNFTGTGFASPETSMQNPNRGRPTMGPRDLIGGALHCAPWNWLCSIRTTLERERNTTNWGNSDRGLFSLVERGTNCLQKGLSSSLFLPLPTAEKDPPLYTYFAPFGVRRIYSIHRAVRSGQGHLFFLSRPSPPAAPRGIRNWEGEFLEMPAAGIHRRPLTKRPSQCVE